MVRYRFVDHLRPVLPGETAVPGTGHDAAGNGYADAPDHPAVLRVEEEDVTKLGIGAQFDRLPGIVRIPWIRNRRPEGSKQPGDTSSTTVPSSGRNRFPLACILDHAPAASYPRFSCFDRDRLSAVPDLVR